MNHVVVGAGDGLHAGANAGGQPRGAPPRARRRPGGRRAPAQGARGDRDAVDGVPRAPRRVRLALRLGGDRRRRHAARPRRSTTCASTSRARGRARRCRTPRSTISTARAIRSWSLVRPGQFLLIAGEDGAAWCEAAKQPRRVGRHSAATRFASAISTATTAIRAAPGCGAERSGRAAPCWCDRTASWDGGAWTPPPTRTATAPFRAREDPVPRGRVTPARRTPAARQPRAARAASRGSADRARAGRTRAHPRDRHPGLLGGRVRRRDDRRDRARRRRDPAARASSLRLEGGALARGDRRRVRGRAARVDGSLPGGDVARGDHGHARALRAIRRRPSRGHPHRRARGRGREPPPRLPAQALPARAVPRDRGPHARRAGAPASWPPSCVRSCASS